MRIDHLQCARCGRKYPKDELRYRCDCGDSIEIVYDYGELAGRISWADLRKRTFCHWRYREFYPGLNKRNIITMGEGGTSLVKSRSIAKKAGCRELLFKMESLNPTGSFKDRGSTVEISQACQYGARELVLASTGNMGASVAAYCARGGIGCTIYVPWSTPEVKLLQMEAHGAIIKRVRGDYTAAALEARSQFEKRGVYLAGDYPYRSEGEKSVGFEIADALGTDYDYIACPIGNGTLLHGIWKGLKEFKMMGLIDRLPRILGVQAEGCNTVVKAFQDNKEIIEPVQPHTLMDAVACGDPLDGSWALKALRESGGIGIAVSDDEAIRVRDMLAREEGIFAELSGALSTAGLMKAYENGMIEKGLKVVSLVTGHGLKEPEAARYRPSKP
ncbi:L-threonine synthase [Methanocella conradii HZ254]|uniref:Threonine synthase n=1 Tax=Methanocella conradii (strain DSM 24694 / JCM 17849 / CGMCC 1.5162 / HZ254) TaxID=1041930 RepID=H8I795_METCZ|nr:threonine synthase [Methanocella conradii]AFD00761.1 L-threonine synthase [Methanocella conradii HZ254]